MNMRSKTSIIDNNYCQICSSTSSINVNKRLSSFSCEHCRLLMCYNCFEKHTDKLIDEYAQLQKHFSKLTNLFYNKQQLFATFEEHCIRSVNSTFDEVLNDLQNLRKESIDYVKQQFNNAQNVISEMIGNIKPLITKSQQNWSRDGITKNVMLELEVHRKQISEIEQNLDLFSLPNMQLKMYTFPRNKLHLYCQTLSNSYTSTKKFSSSNSGKIISTKCSCHEHTEYEREKIDVDTEYEEINQNIYSTKQIQTDSINEYIHHIDNDEDDTNDINTEYCLSKRYISQDIILTNNEVDRIASDGEHLLYFSDTSKTLCYITNILSNKRTKEIACRWAHYPILDLVYSPISSQFICATKTGIYTCTVDSNNDNSTIDIQRQLTQYWSYVRLSVDKNFLWLWTDTPRLNQLRVYSPKTFECIQLFNLNDYSHFSNNSTSFCIHKNLLATVFQFKQITNIKTYKKIFHITFCNNTNLHELFTIYLGECDIDHEIRVNNDGIFFITNGKKHLWIVDSNGKKEYIKLYHIGRALTVHTKNQIFIANGTQQLQSIELLIK